MYVREWTARFAHTDMFQIVFYPELFEVIHDTADRYLESIGYPFWRLADELGVGFPIVEANAEFRAPIRAGDTITVELTHSIGETSLRFDFQATHEDGRDAFTAFEQRVCVSVGGDSPRPIPAEFRQALEACE